MNCPICQLVYNKNRKPLVLNCGHTFCSDCIQIGNIIKCNSCDSSSKPVVNFALYEQVIKKNQTNIDKYIKVCLFGNMNVGKSSILRRLVDDQFQYQTNPTIGIDFKYIDKQIDGKVYRFQIWDSAGQQRYRSMSSHHLKGSDIILLVYDLSRNHDENGISYWISQIENYAKHNNIIVIGNKIDLIQDSKVQQNKSIMKQGFTIFQSLLPSQLKLLDSLNWIHIKASCLNNYNMNQIWNTLITKSKIIKGTTHDEKIKSVILTQEKSKVQTKEKHNTGKTYSKNRESKSNCC